MVSAKVATEAMWAARKSKRQKRKPPDFIDPAFEHQTKLLLDASALICVLCTRRAAKSFSAIKRLLRAMYKHPGSSCLFLGLTRQTAKRVVWKDTLRILNRDHKLGGKWNKSELSFTLPNGSVLYILGVDADDSEREKLLGQKYAEVAIDESASYSIDLHDLVYSVLKPAVADYRGTIGLYGTPGNLKTGIFFDLTNGQNPSKPGRWVGQTLRDGVTYSGWSGHCWSTFQNPYMAEKWQQEIDELKRDNPLIEKTPTFQQNYLGLWVIDESKLVYRYMPVRNDFSGTLPTYHKGEWHFVLAIDLGWEDPCSFTVLAYHDFDRTLYGLKSYKPKNADGSQRFLDLTATKEEADSLKRLWPIETTVIDGANKQAVEEMNNRMGLEAIPAEKKDKFEFIDIMNDEFIQERIKLGPGCEDLKAEYASLVVDEKKLMKRKREEHPACSNHCTDGALYGWRHTWQFLSAALPAKPMKVNSPEWHAAQEVTQSKELEEMHEVEFQRNAEEAREEQEQWG